MNNLIIPFRANLLESGSAPFSNNSSILFDGILEDALNKKLDFTDGNVTIAAHSLGNIVVSHAIAEGNFSPGSRFL